jgi:hypothetical protein
MEFPDPLISVAVEPKTADQDKMGVALVSWRRKIHRLGLILTKNLVI